MANGDDISEDAIPPLPPQLAQQNYQYYSNLPASTPTAVGVPLGLLSTMINRYESGNNYDRLASMPASQGNATSLPVNPSGYAQGFPQWSGARNVYGGTSHGAGVAQFEPSLWDEASRAMGLTDFSPGSQDAARNWAIMNHGILDWRTNQQLSQAIQYYHRTGQIPPASMNFPTNYAAR